MFPEMEDEFDPRDFKETQVIQLQQEEDDNDQVYFKLTLELPYGECSRTFFLRPKGKHHEEEDAKNIDLP